MVTLLFYTSKSAKYTIRCAIWIILLFSSNSIFAVTITSTAGGGNWTDGTSWVGGSAPAATDDVIIVGPINVNNAGGGKIINSITINAGGSITVTPTLTITTFLTLNAGSLSSAADVVSVGTNLTIAAGASVTMGSKNFTVGGTTSIAGSFTDNDNNGNTLFTGLVTLTGAGTFTTTAITTASRVEFRGGIVQAGTGSFAAGASTFSTNAQSISGAGAGSISFGGIVDISIALTNNKTVSVTGNITGVGSWTNATGSTLNYSGVSAPAVTLNASAATNTVNYNLNGAQALKVTTYNNLTISSGGTKTTTGNITVSNTFTMGTSINLNGGAGSLTLGTSAVSTGTFTYTTGNIIGIFNRWISTAATSYEFPVGTAANNNMATFNLVGGITGGTLSVKFVAANPGAAGLPKTESAISFSNQYTTGYWNLIAANSFACTNYNVTLAANGFTAPTTITSITRVIKRTNGGNWAFDGTHVAASAPNCYRNGLNGIAITSTQLGLVTNCVPIIVTHPSSSTVCPASNTTFAVVASGVTLTYQWQISTDKGSTFTNLSNGAPYSNVTTATMTITAATAVMNGYQYRCVVSSSCAPTASSNAGILNVFTLSTPSFTSGSISNRCQGAGSVTYSATVTGQDVGFTDLAGVTASGHDLIKTTADGWNGGAASANKINNNSYAYTIVSETNTHRFFGLSTTNADANFTTIRYAFYMVNTGALQIRELGSTVASPGTYSSGDTLKIAVESSVVKYYKNSTLLYTSALAPTLPLIIDVCIYSMNGTLRNIQTNAVYSYSLDAASVAGGNTINSTTGAVTYAAGWYGNSTITASASGCSGPKTSTHVVNTYSTITSPVFALGSSSTRCQAAGTVSYEATVTGQDVGFTDLAGVTASGHDLIKTTADGWNGGAASANKINNNSYAYTIVSETNTHRFFGLSTTNADANFTTIRYAFYMVNTGALQIRELGSTVASPGTYSSGDTLKIAVESSVVKYYKNSTLLYTSALAPTLPLIIDVCIYSMNGTLRNIQTNAVYSYSLDAASVAGGNTINSTTGAVTYVAGWISNSTITASATSACGGLSTTSHTATSQELPNISSQPAASVINMGANTSFSVTASGASITYQWEEDRGLGWNALSNGGVYSNVTTSTLNLTTPTLSMSGYQYRCIVSGACTPAATSNAVILTVNAVPETQPQQHIQNNY